MSIIQANKTEHRMAATLHPATLEDIAILTPQYNLMLSLEI